MDKFTPDTQKALNIALKSLTHTPEEIEKEQREERSLDYQRRQTISSEEAVTQAKRANEIAEEALKEAKKSNHKANIAIWVSIVSVLAAIASAIIAAIALFE